MKTNSTADPRAANKPDATERLSGTVLRITYRNPENDYRVLKLMPFDQIARERLSAQGEVVVVGYLPGIEVGECIQAGGRWTSHAKHGPQFKADWFKPSLPSTERGIETYLKSGAVKGVGPVLARRIVEAFGDRTFDVLDGDIDRLKRVKGIRGKTFEKICRGWTEARGDRELIAFLGEYGIPSTMAHRLRRTYGEAALSVVRSNPYRLAAEVSGIGFARADSLARRMGMALDSPKRIEAALGHVLESHADEGHTYLTRPRLLEAAIELLGLEPDLIEAVLDRMLADELLTAQTLGGDEDVSAIFLNSLHEAEVACAELLMRLAASKLSLPRVDMKAFLRHFEKRAQIQLAPTQRTAIETIGAKGMMVLTGGPGTGKTTTLRAVIELFGTARLNVRLAAPTGRAARRLAETSHAPAETIHRMLGYQAHTGEFSHNAGNPLEAALIVVDEVSMLDVGLARDLLSAIRPGTCLLLVGDEDQLPSVGPGNVLRDIIAAKAIPIVRLDEVFRQAGSSLIVSNAHRINSGKMPLDVPAETPDGASAQAGPVDYFFVERREPEDILEAVRTLVAERIPARFGLDPIQDVQILTPMRRGDLGVERLNRELQNALNPETEVRPGQGQLDESGPENVGRPKLRVGDRVMQTANDYEKDLANGDIGRVRAADAATGEVIVDFDGRAVSFLADESHRLALAYAVTIHKSQGSEYPAVVIPMHMQHYVMLQRNLLYTALTRGRRLVCIVGDKRALWRAVNNSTRRSRNSALGYFIDALRGDRAL